MTAKILYVEDNEDNVYMLTSRLRRRGYDVVVAPTASRASPWRFPKSRT